MKGGSGLPFFFVGKPQTLNRPLCRNKTHQNMKWLTIDYIKAHSRIDYDCEDAELELYGTAAEDAILDLCRRTYENILDVYGDVPAKIRQASLMLTDHLYQYRGLTTPGNVAHVPYGFDFMVKEFMVLSGESPIEIERDCLLAKLATVSQDFDFAYGSIDLPTEEQQEQYVAKHEKLAAYYDRYGSISPTKTICQSLRQVVAAEKAACDEIIKTWEGE